MFVYLVNNHILMFFPHFSVSFGRWSSHYASTNHHRQS